YRALWAFGDRHRGRHSGPANLPTPACCVVQPLAFRTDQPVRYAPPPSTVLGPLNTLPETRSTNLGYSAALRHDTILPRERPRERRYLGIANTIGDLAYRQAAVAKKLVCLLQPPIAPECLDRCSVHRPKSYDQFRSVDPN